MTAAEYNRELDTLYLLGVAAALAGDEELVEEFATDFADLVIKAGSEGLHLIEIEGRLYLEDRRN